MEVSSGLASLLGISGARLKARSRDLEAGGPRTFSGLDPGRYPTEADAQTLASRKTAEKPKRALEKHTQTCTRTGAPWVGRAGQKSTLSRRTALEQRTTEAVRAAAALGSNDRRTGPSRANADRTDLSAPLSRAGVHSPCAYRTRAEDDRVSANRHCYRAQKIRLSLGKPQ